MTEEAPTFEIPDALRPAIDMLTDAHAQWHDAVDSYHDPEAFRRHVDSLIQSLRNVTWRIQSEKAALPADFDQWYGKWQELMKADAQLAWLGNARTEVVKRSGIDPNSLAIVRVIDSYAEPMTTLLTLPARTPTDRVIERARKKVPAKFQPHVAIEVVRRWEVDELDGAELTDVLAHCWRTLDALVMYILELAHGESPEDPADFVSTVQVPECMLGPNPSWLPLMVEADTGELYGVDFVATAKDESLLERAADRYKARKLPMLSHDDTLEVTAGKFHDHARNVFRKDGYHLPMLHLFGPGEHELFVMTARDKRDKYVQWHRVGLFAMTQHLDSFVFTTEAWRALMRPNVQPYEEVEHMPGRKEELVTWYEAADGTMGSYTSEIVRLLGKPYLRKTSVDKIGMDPDGAVYASPLRRAWVMRGHVETETRTRQSTTATHDNN